jgi:hypothetical protein
MKGILTIYIVLYIVVCIILAAKYQYTWGKLVKILREKYPDKLEEYCGVNNFAEFLRQFLKTLLPFYKVTNNADSDLSRLLIKLRNSWIFLLLWFIFGGCFVFLLPFILVGFKYLLGLMTI